MSTEYFDVIIVGAGLSGIGAAWHLQKQCPDKSYQILEARGTLGGTWDLFRYPGIRSDSDMYTLGYNFKPWREAKTIADGPAILAYLQNTAADNGIEQHIRYDHHVKRASWSGAKTRWNIEATRTGGDQTVRLACNMLLMCAGYFSYAGGYTPKFVGRENFRGPVIHPQSWPQDLDYSGKKMIVIGSGATAMTLVPALSRNAGHVTMLQRSPTWVISQPAEDRMANFFRRVLPERAAYSVTRLKYITSQQLLYRASRKFPGLVGKYLLRQVRHALGDDLEMQAHFTPGYRPWEQRLCLIPDNDLFHAIRSGRVSVVTDQIVRFTKKGILLHSGEELEADIVITATGLQLVVMGGTEFEVDGAPVDFSNTFTYKGIMVSDVPNMISTFGYINASWTLRADLIAEYACRLINHMDEHKYHQCTPRLRDGEGNMPARDWIEGFSSAYLQRTMSLLPRQGQHEPWINAQNYRHDKKMTGQAAIEDRWLEFR